MLLGHSAVSRADLIVKANNSDLLTNSTSWIGGNVPRSIDIASWDSTVTAANTSSFAGFWQVAGLSITNPGGAVTINPGGTLSLGSMGIDMGNATVDLTLKCPLMISGNQAWNVAAGRSLTATSSTNNQSLFLGGYTLYKWGAGTTTFQGMSIQNGTFEIDQGTLAISPYTWSSTLANTVTVVIGSEGTLSMGRSSGTNTMNAFVLFNGGLFTWAAIGGGSTIASTMLVGENGGTLRMTTSSSGGVANIYSGQLAGGGALNVRNECTTSANNRIEFSGSNSGFFGTISINATSGNRYVRLTKSTAGSAGAEWNVAAGNRLEVAGVTVALGSLTGSGVVRGSTGTSTLVVGDRLGDAVFSGVIDNTNVVNLTKQGGSTFTLSGANTYTGATTVAGGLLVVAGSLGNSAVTVQYSGALGGGGTIGGPVSLAGSISPGNGIGILTTGSQAWSEGGDYN